MPANQQPLNTHAESVVLEYATVSTEISCQRKAYFLAH